jgi:hypothetical protein
VPQAAATPRSGTTAIIGIAAMSWNSKIENAADPPGVLFSLRSSSVASAIAVDDSDSPSAPISATFQPTPSSMATPATWAPPQPKIARRIDHRRFGSSSRPIMNSSSTTPNSAKCRMTATASMRRSPHGPMAMPASR